MEGTLNLRTTYSQGATQLDNLFCHDYESVGTTDTRNVRDPSYMTYTLNTNTNRSQGHHPSLDSDANIGATMKTDRSQLFVSDHGGHEYKPGSPSIIRLG